MNVTITPRLALELLREVVKTHGEDHRAKGEGNQDGCRYVVDPHALVLVSVCIVGKVFDALGILRALLDPEAQGQYGSCEVYRDDMWNRAEVFGVSFDIDARFLLRAVQMHQDAGRPWGLAVEAGALDFLAHKAGEVRDSLGMPNWHDLTVTVEGEDSRSLVKAYNDAENERLRQAEADEAEAEMMRDLQDNLGPVGSF